LDLVHALADGVLRGPRSLSHHGHTVFERIDAKVKAPLPLVEMRTHQLVLLRQRDPIGHTPPNERATAVATPQVNLFIEEPLGGERDLARFMVPLIGSLEGTEGS